MSSNATVPVSLQTLNGYVRTEAIDSMWGLLCFAEILFMQCGFAMLEVGYVRSKNAQNILVKNLGDATLGFLVYWACGYAFAFGPDSNGFIGSGWYFLADFPSSHNFQFLFQYAFSITSTTIISGAMAERTRFEAYFVYTMAITGFVYPVVSHWLWSPFGWLSPLNVNPLFGSGALDYAGSGAVHMNGGVAALVGAYLVRPRTGRFDANGRPKPIHGHSVVLSSLGTFILWFGFYGFNGSIVSYSQDYKVVATSILNTTVSAMTGTVAAMLCSVYFERKLNLLVMMNGLLVGLVSICSGCGVVRPWAAALTGFTSAPVYYAAAYLILHRLHVDDPLEAAAVHGAAGLWGLFCTGLFADRDLLSQMLGRAPDTLDAGLLTGGTGALFACQLVAILCIGVWSFCLSTAIFLAIRSLVGLRVSRAVEESGLDVEHGEITYMVTNADTIVQAKWTTKSSRAKMAKRKSGSSSPIDSASGSSTRDASPLTTLA